MTKNKVSVIVRANFRTLSLKRKDKIKKLGQPTPHLNLWQ